MKEINKKEAKMLNELELSRKSYKGKTIFDDMPKWYSLTTPFELAITG